MSKQLPRRSRPLHPTNRREKAEARNAKWAALTPEQQLAALDAKLGPGVGAKRQRAALAAKLLKLKAPK